MKKQVSGFAVTVPLPPGTHYYKFIVDGVHWYYDVLKEHLQDSDGNTNNVIYVSAPGAQSKQADGSSQKPVTSQQDNPKKQQKQQPQEHNKQKEHNKQPQQPKAKAPQQAKPKATPPPKDSTPKDERALLEEQLTKLKQETDQLRGEIQQAKSKKFYDWTLRQRTTISDILSRPDRGEALIGSSVGVAGWIKTIRLQARDTVAFVKVNDGSTWQEIQVVIPNQVQAFSHILDHTACIGASVYVLGEVKLSLGKEQKVEILASDMILLGPSDAEKFPIAKASLSLEYLREVGHMRPRANVIAAVTKVRNSLAYATHLFFQESGFLYVNTPLITAADCEGAGELFQVTSLLKTAQEDPTKIPAAKDGKILYENDFFKKKTFLTVSGQLNAEIYACALGSVYTFGPTFRAEDSHTARHLAEFWMIEPEIAFADLEEDMNVAEQYVKFCLSYVLKKHDLELQFLEQYEQKGDEAEQQQQQKQQGQGQKGKKQEPKGKGAPKQEPKESKGFRDYPLRQRLQAIVKADFARITYTEAIDILLKSNVTFERKVEWGLDLGSEHEKWLAEVHFRRPVIVRNYPKKIKAFYMRENEDGKTVAAMDMLVPGVGELIGGSQREERLDILADKLRSNGLDPETYSWYLDLRRYGSVPHSGFGLGFERLVCFTTGMENIREAIPFPRFPGHADF